MSDLSFLSGFITQVQYSYTQVAPVMAVLIVLGVLCVCTYSLRK